jgi:hypothetical protein
MRGQHNIYPGLHVSILTLEWMCDHMVSGAAVCGLCYRVRERATKRKSLDMEQKPCGRLLIFFGLLIGLCLNRILIKAV